MKQTEKQKKIQSKVFKNTLKRLEIHNKKQEENRAKQLIAAQKLKQEQVIKYELKKGNNELAKEFENLLMEEKRPAGKRLKRKLKDENVIIVPKEKIILQEFDLGESETEDCENEEIKTMFKNAEKNGYSNASDIMEAFGVEIISADSLIEYYEEIIDCNDLKWKVIEESYRNDDWQDEGSLFEALK